MWMCKNHPHCYYPKGEKFHLSEMPSEKVANVYKVRLGVREGQTIWIVDGSRLDTKVFPDFLYGGNDQRYRFNPPNDIMIDDRCGIQELEYTIRHELLERNEMLTKGLSYTNAHNAALELERTLRTRDFDEVKRYRRKLASTFEGFEGKRGFVTPEILGEAYKMRLGKYRGIDMWVVDGSFVRQFIEPDFSYGATDKFWDFIPENEMWLESSLSCDHAHYVKVYCEAERRAYLSGIGQKKATGMAFLARVAEFERQRRISLNHEKKVPAVRFGVRERGHKCSDHKEVE